MSSNDWTVAKLHALPDDGNRYEIIDGALFVTPTPRDVHQRAALVLYDPLKSYANAVGMDVMPLLADIQYSARTLVQPDLFVFRNPPGNSVADWVGVQPLQLVV